MSSPRLIKLPEVLQRTGLSRTPLYKQLSDGTFPKPVTVGPRAVAWVDAEVNAWIEARIAARDCEGTAA